MSITYSYNNNEIRKFGGQAIQRWTNSKRNETGKSSHKLTHSTVHLKIYDTVLVISETKFRIIINKNINKMLRWESQYRKETKNNDSLDTNIQINKIWFIGYNGNKENKNIYQGHSGQNKHKTIKIKHIIIYSSRSISSTLQLLHETLNELGSLQALLDRQNPRWWRISQGYKNSFYLDLQNI